MRRRAPASSARRTRARASPTCALPTGEARRRRSANPNCTGAPPDVEGCFLANMVTDVVVAGRDNDATTDRSPGAVDGLRASPSSAGARATRRARVRSYPGESPEQRRLHVAQRRAGHVREARCRGGAVQRPGADRPRRARARRRARAGPQLPLRDRRGRGPLPRRRAGDRRDSDPSGPIPNNTVLDGIYVSDDFGGTWTRMNSGDELKDPGTRLRADRNGLRRCSTARASRPGTTSSSRPTRRARRGRRADAADVRARGGLAELRHRRPAGRDAVRLRRRRRRAAEHRLAVRRHRPVLRGRDLPVPQHRPARTARPPRATGRDDHDHPDQHAAIWIPRGDGGVTYVVGHDGGVNVQTRRRGRGALARRLGPRRQRRLQHAAALRRAGRQGRHDLGGPAGQRRDRRSSPTATST